MDQLTAHDPRRIGPFEVLARLGAGGMGLVYLARSASGRRVAIKTVRAELAEDELFRVRFSREISAAKTVSGFYTAAVVEADADAPVPWLATAYVPAPSLEDLVGEVGPLPVEAVRWLAAGIAEALQSIHAAGLVHRDLKPSNVLVVEDGPRVIDFGIAAGVSHTRLTMTNVAVGTPAYMSPEQARDSRSVTGASDVFSLGSLLVFAATGHPPYRGVNPVETVFMLLREQPDLSGLPEALAPLVRACMRPEAESRPTPAEIQAELAPHLFAQGDDGEGDAGEWLPQRAIELIERKRGRRTVVAPLPPSPPGAAPPQPMRVPPPMPAVPPRAAPAVPMARRDGPEQVPARAVDGLPGPRAALPLGGGPAGPPAMSPPRPADSPAAEKSAPGPRHRGGPALEGGTGVRLAGASVPIGPGLRADVPVPPAVAAGASPVTDWVRRVPMAPPPAPAAPPQAAPVPAAPAPVSAPRPQPASAPWRPWRFRMSNDVWGTPIVADGILFVSSFEVHALDIATGRRRFKTRDVAWAVAVSGGLVHAADGPHLYTLDTASGSERWRTALDGWVYSLDASKGAVCAGIRGGGVQVRGAADGAELWRTTGAQQDYETAQSGPALVGDCVYYYGGGRLHAADLHTGRVRWTFTVGEDVPARPVERDGTLYVTAGTRVFALDTATGAEEWRFEAPVVLFTPPALDPPFGGLSDVTRAAPGVYVADYLGTLYALDATTGRPRWRGRTGSRQGAEPVVVTEGVVLIGSGDTVFAFESGSGRERWRYTARGEVVGSPAVAGGLVHVGSRDQSLHTLDLATGRLRWELGTKGELTGSPVAADGKVFVGSKDRCVYALDARYGTAIPEEPPR